MRTPWADGEGRTEIEKDGDDFDIDRDFDDDFDIDRDFDDDFDGDLDFDIEVAIGASH
jgi:hypothetical protein